MEMLQNIEPISWMVILCSLTLFSFIIYDIWKIRYGKPEFKFSKDEHCIIYRSRYFGGFRPLYKWNPEKKKRIVTVHNTLSHSKYDLDYVGPGRELVVSIDEIDMSKYKNAKDVDNEQISYINNENIALTNIIKNLKIRYECR